MKPFIAIGIFLFCLQSLIMMAQQTDMAFIPDGSYAPFIKGQTDQISVDGFWMDEKQVTNGEFLEFVANNPRWSREQIKSLFADDDYLSQWNEQGADPVADQDLLKPVVNVSWFAAQAYCESEGKRLPTMHEWEYAATALPIGETDSSSLQNIIANWYSRKSGEPGPVGSVYKSQHGVWDMYGQVWEWVYDFNSVVNNEDSRNQEEAPEGLFCGSASLNANDASDYATFVRFAFRGSLKGNYTTRKLGFRCVKSIKIE
jgi:formylglycine-generating enzyme